MASTNQGPAMDVSQLKSPRTQNLHHGTDAASVDRERGTDAAPAGLSGYAENQRVRLYD